MKLGVARFERDVMVLPMRWNDSLGHVVRRKTFEKGGHFAAWESPGVIVEEVRTMFGRGGGAEGCVKERSGYSE